MKYSTFTAGLIVLALLVGASPTLAQDRPATSGPTSSKAAKKEPAKPVKPVDINSASKTELKKLPGIGDADAERIVSGRPYLSKADLVTRKIIPAGTYVQIKGRIIAR